MRWDLFLQFLEERAWQGGTKICEEKAKQIWPLRSKGDGVLRRTRWFDLFKVAEQEGFVLKRLICLVGMDYIHALNLAWWMLLVQDTKGMEDVLPLDIKTSDLFFGKLSDELKSTDVEEGWEPYAEMKNLTGYRLLPWPGYDDYADTVALAEGGVEKHTIGGRFNGAWMRTALSSTPKNDTAYIDFDEYVASGKWLTSGASSMGRLEVEYEGKITKVKCRKNMVPDAISLEDLPALALEQLEQISTAFDKNETGKVRIAVCSDLLTYLKMNYITELSGRRYKHWKNVTRNETGREKLRRIIRMMEQCHNGYGMAWDYKGFERQVALEDLDTLIAIIGEQAIDNTPIMFRQKVSAIVDQCRVGLYRSYIIPKNAGLGGRAFKIEVTGGLPSGLYITSIAGDGYNKTMDEYVAEICTLLGLSKGGWGSTEIQGDDTSKWSRKIAYLQICDWLMSVTGAEGATGKFGITTGRTEFLRVSFSETGARGYLARSIPGIVQRKPWSDTPQDEISIISAVTEAALICRRRGGIIPDRMITKLQSLWCRKNRVDLRILQTPVENGGFGLYPYRLGSVEYTMHKTPINAKVSLKTDFRKKGWEKKATELGLPADKAEELAHEDALATIIGDEVRGLSQSQRRQNLLRLKSAAWTSIDPPLVILDGDTLEGDINKIAIDVYEKRGWDSNVKIANEFNDAKRLIGKEANSWVEKRWGIKPNSIRWTRYVETPTVPIFDLHPLLSEPFKMVVLNQVRWGRTNRKNIASVVQTIAKCILPKFKFLANTLIKATMW